MADTLGKDAQWWANQAENYKHELDVLNPKLDSATSQIALLQERLKGADAAAIALASLQSEHATVKTNAAAEIERLAASGRTKDERIAALEQANEKHRRNVAACAAAVGPLHQALSDSLSVQD